MGRKDKDADRANAELQRQNNPERAAHLGSKRGSDDAFCTDCYTWYDSTNDALVNRHAH